MIAPFLSSASAFVATFSKPPKGSDVQKVVVSGVNSAEGWNIRTERFTEKQAFTDAAVKIVGDVSTVLAPWLEKTFRQVLIQTPEADLQILRAYKGGEVKTSTKRLPPSRSRWEGVAADRTKPKALTPEIDTALLVALDLATPDGKIKAAMADKFRQVNHLLAGARHGLPDSGSYHIVDAGCGKAYLSLSLMYVLQREGIDVHLHGIDANQHVVDHCITVAQKLELSNATFTCARIGDVVPTHQCDLLIALHACDTATDEAIALGLAMKAKKMLVAPCCHHEVQKHLRKESVPDYARPLLDDGITKERLGDLLTDSMRRDILRALGYEAHLEEFISLEHTQKNILLRAESVHTNERDRLHWADRVRDMILAWGVAPRLMSMVTLPSNKPPIVE